MKKFLTTSVLQRKSCVRRAVIGLIAFSFIASILMPIHASATTVPLESCAQKEIIAHRGRWDATRTENTMRAYQYAVETGSKIVEMDTQLTRDGHWVMMHDLRLNRTTNKWGYVKNRSLAYIKSARTNDGTLGGVPTLREVFTYFQGQPDVKLHFEIKTQYVSNTKLAGLLAMINQYGLKDRIIFELANTNLTDRIYAMDPSYVHSIVMRSSTTPDFMKRHHATILVLRHNYVTPSLVDAMHANGIKVWSWTIDTETPWRASTTANVDGIITNRIGTITNLCATAVQNATNPTPAP